MHNKSVPYDYMMPPCIFNWSSIYGGNGGAIDFGRGFSCKVLFRFKSFLCFSVASTHGANEGLGREQVVHTKYLSVGLHLRWAPIY